MCLRLLQRWMWEEVPLRRPPWRLRAQDWGDPIVAYDEIANELRKLTGDKVFRAIIACEPDQIEAIRAVVRAKRMRPCS